MQRYQYVLASFTFVLLIVGCDRDSVRDNLDALANQIRATHGTDTSVWNRIATVRSSVIEHNCKPCDSVYNSLVASILEHNLHNVPGPHKFHYAVRNSNVQIDSNEALVLTAHDLRFWGSFNAARSVYTQSCFNDMELADAYGNISMEYLRLGLYRPALRAALNADSIFVSKNNYQGRVWTERLLYSAFSKLGDRSKALASLDSFFVFRTSTIKATPWRPTDTLTDFNLITSILSNHDVIHNVDLKRAFGNDAEKIKHSYVRYRDSQKAPDLGQLWDTRNLRSTIVPKPVIRTAEYFNLRPWIDSIGSRNQRLIAYTRYGSFVLEGNTWTCVSDGLNSTSIVGSALPSIDTVYVASNTIKGVFPSDKGQLIVVTTRHIVDVFDDSIKIRQLPRELTGDNAPVSIVPTPTSGLLTCTVRGVYLLDRNTYSVKARLLFNSSEKRPLFFPNSPVFISLIDSDNAIVKQSRSSNLWGVKFSADGSNLAFAETHPLHGSHVALNRESVWRSVWHRIEGIQSSAYANRNGDSVYVYDHTYSELGAIDPMSKSRDRTLSRRTQIHSPSDLIALRSLDHLDVIDTSAGISFPQLSTPIPATDVFEQSLGVYRDQDARLCGYYSDGYAIVRFPLSQASFPLSPDVKISNISRGSEGYILTDQLVLEAGQKYRVYTTSNLITSAYNVLVWKNDKDSISKLIAGWPHFWQVEFEPTEDDSVFFVKIPATGQTYKLAVRTPFYKRSWVINSTYPVAIMLVLGAALFGTLRYRQLQQEKIQHAKSQQLDLIREDMHDMIGSRLVRIASLARQTKPEDADAALARIHDMTLVTVRSLRNLLSLMSETTMTDAEFFGALREYVVESCTDAALTPTVVVNTIDDQRTTLDGGNRHELMMIVSEMLANTLRHAQARTVSFTVHSDASGTTLTWNDDGIGIGPSSQRGNGLNNIQRRAARLHASVNLISHPGGGTQYTITIPPRTS